MSDTYVNVTRIQGQGMLTLRADLSDKAVVKAVRTALGQDVPATSTASDDGMAGAAWMSPDELLILCADANRADTMAKLQKALAKTHHLLVDVSDARAVFTLDGDGTREVLAKLSPSDVMSLAANDLRRTRLGQVVSAFWLSSDSAATIVCFRSVGDYMHKMLLKSASPLAKVF
ncbi:MAG: sarcosine oxidase subunit gamma [Planktomarina sp.]